MWAPPAPQLIATQSLAGACCPFLSLLEAYNSIIFLLIIQRESFTAEPLLLLEMEEVTVMCLHFCKFPLPVLEIHDKIESMCILKRVDQLD